MERLTARASGEVKLNPTYKLKPKRVRLAPGESKRLKLKPTTWAARKIAAALKRGEGAAARVTVKLTDPGGNDQTERLRMRLRDDDPDSRAHATVADGARRRTRALVLPLTPAPRAEAGARTRTGRTEPGAVVALLASLLLLPLAGTPRAEAIAHSGAGSAAPGLYGVVSQGDLDEIDFRRMRLGGVASLRFLLDRRWVEPERGVRDWTYLDRFVDAASRNAIELLPFVYGSPAWVAPDHAQPPIHSQAERVAWRCFLRALAERYGRDGTFWDRRASRRPITTWQIWNEPNLPIYWRPAPAANEYARLVRISEAAIRSADPHAEIMFAGLAPTRAGIPADAFLARLYAERRMRRAADIVALHPYASRIETLQMQVERVRSVMISVGESRTPLAITELGWASRADPAEVTPGAEPHALVRGPRGQARMLRKSFELLWRKRVTWSLDRVQWFAWKDAIGSVEELCDFCRYAGLFGSDGRAKPAWGEFRRFALRAAAVR